MQKSLQKNNNLKYDNQTFLDPTEPFFFSAQCFLLVVLVSIQYGKLWHTK